MEAAGGFVRTTRHGGIGSIEFFHPQSNSLPRTLLDQLVSEIHSAGHDEEIKVIILRSAGENAFCAGASFSEMSSLQTAAEGKYFFSGIVNVIQAMRKCPKLIIARIQGKCIGGGVGLAATADYAIAVTGAEVRLSELSIGIGPFVIGPAVERKIGISAFSQLSLDAGSWRSAEWAKTKGLYAEVHDSAEGLDESIQRLANNLSHSNPAAMQELKHILWHGTGDWDQLLDERAAISGKLVIGSFTKTAIEHFREKKK
jgi:methylglutaconyl-CoA hydratase